MHGSAIVTTAEILWAVLYMSHPSDDLPGPMELRPQPFPENGPARPAEGPRERVIAGRMVNWRLMGRRCVQRTIGRAHLPVIPYSDEKIPCSLKATSKPSLRLNVQPPGAWRPGERRAMPMNAVAYRSRSWKEVRAAIWRPWARRFPVGLRTCERPTAWLGM